MPELPSVSGSAPAARKKLQVLYMQPNTKSFAGIERVVDELCSQLVESYHDTFDVDVFYPSRYENFEIGERRYRKIAIECFGRVGFMRVVRQVIAAKQYDVVVIPQVEPTVICWVACLGLRKTFVTHLHGNPRLERSHIKAKILFFLMDKWVLSRLPVVFGTSPKQLEAFKSMFGDVPTCWVPNPVRGFESVDSVPAAPGIVTFVNVARFSYQKGQDILIDAFAKVHRERLHARLRIVGYGEGEAAIRDAIRNAGLEDVIRIENLPDNPQSALAASDVYVSSSRWEGWSLAICEALRFGLPVVATDCEFGPSDILTDAKLGRLVPLSKDGALAQAMLYYCDNLAAETMHASYRKDYIDQYNVEKVVHVHAEALKRAASASFKTI